MMNHAMRKMGGDQLLLLHQTVIKSNASPADYFSALGKSKATFFFFLENFNLEKLFSFLPHIWENIRHWFVQNEVLLISIAAAVLALVLCFLCFGAIFHFFRLLCRLLLWGLLICGRFFWICCSRGLGAACQLMRAPGLACTIPRVVFEAAPRFFFLCLRGRL